MKNLLLGLCLSISSTLTYAGVSAVITSSRAAELDGKIEIIGNSDGKCSPLKFEILKGQTIELTLIANDKMFLLESPELNLELMVGANSQDSQAITFENEGLFNFTCGVHGGAQQSHGEFKVR